MVHVLDRLRLRDQALGREAKPCRRALKAARLRRRRTAGQRGMDVRTPEQDGGRDNVLCPN